MVIRPTGDNVVLQLQKVEDKTQSGIILVKQKQNNLQVTQGTVIAVGSGRTLNNGEHLALNVYEGDKVLFNIFAGTEMTVGDEQYLMVKENDILAILND